MLVRVIVIEQGRSTSFDYHHDYEHEHDLAKGNQAAGCVCRIRVAGQSDHDQW